MLWGCWMTRRIKKRINPRGNVVLSANQGLLVLLKRLLVRLWVKGRKEIGSWLRRWILMTRGNRSLGR